MPLKKRIWLALIGLLLLVIVTLILIGSVIMEHDFKASMPTFGLFGFIWVICIPLLIRLRKMIADQKLERR